MAHVWSMFYRSPVHCSDKQHRKKSPLRFFQSLSARSLKPAVHSCTQITAWSSDRASLPPPSTKKSSCFRARRSPVLSTGMLLLKADSGAFHPKTLGWAAPCRGPLQKELGAWQWVCTRWSEFRAPDKWALAIRSSFDEHAYEVRFLYRT